MTRSIRSNASRTNSKQKKQVMKKHTAWTRITFAHWNRYATNRRVRSGDRSSCNVLTGAVSIRDDSVSADAEGKKLGVHLRGGDRCRVFVVGLNDARGRCRARSLLPELCATGRCWLEHLAYGSLGEFEMSLAAASIGILVGAACWGGKGVVATSMDPS